MSHSCSFAKSGTTFLFGTGDSLHPSAATSLVESIRLQGSSCLAHFCSSLEISSFPKPGTKLLFGTTGDSLHPSAVTSLLDSIRSQGSSSSTFV